ncbi:MAG: hypothetical protein K0V04_24110 [Deltaproteobacteria bacterium]|nr:hypothetical protein [Deltaproteobacteria bacterium]
MKMIWVAGTVAILVAGTGMWMVDVRTDRETTSRASPPSERRTESAPTAVSANDREVADLRHELRTLRGDLDEVSTLPDSSEPRVDSPDEALEPEPEPDPEQRHAEQEQFYDDTFEQQGLDAAWAEREEQQMIEAFGSESFAGLQLTTVQCRATMCRIDIELDRPDDREVFLARLGQPPLNKGGHFRPGEDDRALVVFTGREGHPVVHPE